MNGAPTTEDKERRSLQLKYEITAWFYDILDYPWERQYRHWRPRLVGDARGSVLEAGVGTGRNLKYYDSGVNFTAIDLCLFLSRAELIQRISSLLVTEEFKLQ